MAYLLQTTWKIMDLGLSCPRTATTSLTEPMDISAAIYADSTSKVGGATSHYPHSYLATVLAVVWMEFLVQTYRA